MENSLRSVLEIIARWSKSGFLLLIILISFTLPAQEVAQENSDLSKKELVRFNELFFMAEKEKNLGNLREAKVIYEELYKMSKLNATVCYELAVINAAEGNANDALFFGEKAVSLKPDNKWFKIMLASIYREFDQSEGELAIFRDLVKLEPKNPDYRYELAIAYLNANEYQKAIDELNKLEEIIGINEVLSDQKKQIYLEVEDVEGAAGEIQKLIEAYPRELNYYGTLARIYEVNGFDEKALDIYNKMLEIAPNDPRPHLDLAEYYREKGDKDKSLIHLKQAISSPELDIDSKIPVLLSLFDASKSDPLLQKEAFAMLQDVLRTHPEEAKAHAIHGDYLSRDGRNTEALQAYKKAVSLPGGNKFQIWEQILLIEIQTDSYDSLVLDGPKAIDLFPNQPLPYFFSGVAFLMKGELDEAVYFLEDGLNYVISNPRLKEQFYLQLADAYNRKKEFANSDKYFEKVLALNPNNATALNNYAYYLSLREDKLDKALKMTAYSNSLSPDNAVFLDTYAWVLYQNGQYEEALKKMERVILLGGAESGEVLEHYGDILLKNNQEAKALEQYQKARLKGDSSSLIDEKIKRLSTQ